LKRYIYREDPESQNDFFGIVIHEMPSLMAIEAGLITQKFLNAERQNKKRFQSTKNENSGYKRLTIISGIFL
jgi:hypothetical protein